MKLVDRFKSYLARTLMFQPSGYYSSNSHRSDGGELVNAQTALGVSAVWACVNLVAGTSATLPCMVYRKNGNGERVEARDHPLFKLLHESPNFDQTAIDFWEFMFASLELWGNAFANIERLRGRIISITPINPELVAVRRLADGSIEYRWSENGQSNVKLDTEVLHIRGFGGNPLGGMSTLQFGRNSFGIARSLEKSAANMFENGMMPSGALIFDKFLSEEQRKVANDRLVSQFVGAQNAGKPLVLEGGTKWETLNINPEDAQLLESRSFSVEDICRLFGVPPFMVGHTSKTSSWGKGLQEQVLGFQKFTLRRRSRRVEAGCRKQLLSAADIANGIFIEFNFDELLRGDSGARAEYYKVMTQIGAYTINEVRAKENMPPIEGGDVARMQSQNIPINQSQSIDQEQ